MAISRVNVARRRCLLGVVALVQLVLVCPIPAQKVALTSFANPLIGTKPTPSTKLGYAWDTGNVFPGAVTPRGMVSWSPDTTHNKQIAGGYWYPDNKIEDFSLTHFSGRGVPCLKDIAFMPLVGEAGPTPGTNWPENSASFSHANENASPGYYRVKFDNGIETELTATPRTGMARFAFPKNSNPRLLIRANGHIVVFGNEVYGFADSHVGNGGPYRIFFHAEFEQPIRNVRTWTGDRISDGNEAEGPSSGAVLTFDPAAAPVVVVRVAISFTSQQNAKDNLKSESTGWDFTSIRRQADARWNAELSRIEIEGGTPGERRVFYTALYHCFIHPNLLEDANGEYLGMDNQVHTVEQGHHQYQNIPAWDQHRSHAPLMAILVPQETSDVLQSLVNYATQDQSVRPQGGGLARWQQVNRNSGGMVGDGDDTIVATSYAFGVRGFDTKGALAAMLKGASVPGTTSDGRKVRDGLADYMKLGYVAGAASVTLEYANDDFALSRFAKALGDEQDFTDYSRRAQDWENLFDPSTGYLRPRLADGTFLQPFSPDNGKGFVEGTAAQYLWMVNFNLRGLIDKLGGNQKAQERLDRLFTQVNGGLKSEYAYMGNETCEELPWVYDFLSAPSRTQASSVACSRSCSRTNPTVFREMTMPGLCRRGMSFLRWDSTLRSRA